MYLSQLILDPHTRQVRRELANPYEMHRTLLRAFPSAENGGSGRVLFRVETPTQPTQTTLAVLVQSEKAPDWTGVVDRPGYDLPQVSQNPKQFEPALQPGQRLMFRLRANPTVKRKFPGETKSKRVGLYREEEQRDWLARKAQEGGFKVLGVRVTPEGVVGGTTKDRHRLKLLAVRFDGLLQVTDPDRFFATMQKGVGSGKGLGFGLLSVAPA